METWIIFVATVVVILILGTLIQERSNPISIILLYSPSIPRRPSLGAAFFITTPQKLKIFIINQKKCIFL
jgi:hypothetical protein